MKLSGWCSGPEHARPQCERCRVAGCECAGCGARQGETGEVWENKGGPEGASTPTDPNRPTRITEQRG